MGVIRKKTATRGGEGGVKYVCDVCSADITSTVSPHPSLVLLLTEFLTLHPHNRSGLDVLTVPVTTTIFVWNASRMATPHTIISPRATLSESLNKIQYLSTTRTGVQMRNCSCWRVLKYMGWGHGQTLRIILEDIGIRTRLGRTT